MNYYEHHLGDYAAATAHLSWDEDMAYTRLLRAYYHHEKGIQQGQEYRLARATTTAQRRAVDTVLAEFFALVDGMHVQKRADEEIARYQDKQRKAKASANARWSQSERNANASTDQAPDAMRTHSEGNAPSLQTPDTKKEHPPTPRKRGNGFDPAAIPLPDWLPRDEWERWCVDRRERRKPITAQGAAGQIARLEKLRAEGHAPAAVIGNAIAAGYQGLFAPPRDASAPPAFVTKREEQIRAMSGGLASVRTATPQPETIDGIGLVRAVG